MRLPIVDRLIPIIADDYADPEKGSGAVKITPAHDFNDFKVGQRHKLPMINIFTPDAALNDEVPAPYRGLDRFGASDRERAFKTGSSAVLEAFVVIAETSLEPCSRSQGCSWSILQI